MGQSYEESDQDYDVGEFTQPLLKYSLLLQKGMSQYLESLGQKKECFN
jgi:hypothetical protein